MTKEEQVLWAFRDLFNKMVWLNQSKMEARLKGHKPSEVHCIEYIRNHRDPNVTQLAEGLYMTRGAISKMTKKLIQKNLIESYQKSGNKKEIYFRLTERGEEVNVIHEELHKQFRERDKIVFEHVTEEQYDSMLAFIEKYRAHLDVEIKKMVLENKKEGQTTGHSSR
ncbi:MAG: MarR family transcriptional regulator [Sporolactobacillus sp.]